MTEKGHGMQQPIRITLAMALWAGLLWFFTLGQPSWQPIARVVFIVFVIPNGIVEWLKYKEIIGEQRAGVAKIVFMVAAALIWYLWYR